MGFLTCIHPHGLVQLSMSWWRLGGGGTGGSVSPGLAEVTCFLGGGPTPIKGPRDFICCSKVDLDTASWSEDR